MQISVLFVTMSFFNKAESTFCSLGAFSMTVTSVGLALDFSASMIFVKRLESLVADVICSFFSIVQSDLG